MELLQITGELECTARASEQLVRHAARCTVLSDEFQFSFLQDFARCGL
jgi:hypothetical protein